MRTNDGLVSSTQAAGSLVIEEAGGRVTDIHGADLDFATGRLLIRNEGVIASNGRLHPVVPDAVRRVGSPMASGKEVRPSAAQIRE